jgi:peroxiredoxin
VLSSFLFLAIAAVATLIGSPVPDWPAKPAGRWVQGGPVTLSGLRGKVVLVRFFTDTSCPYCSETAPALNELHREFSGRGLVVIGVFTPKPKPRTVEVAEARTVARAYGFEFPVVVDDNWGALRALWLDREPDAEFTSASLLIDRRGVVRHVHGGGAYARDSKDYRKMRDAVAMLVAETP